MRRQSQDLYCPITCVCWQNRLAQCASHHIIVQLMLFDCSCNCHWQWQPCGTSICVHMQLYGIVAFRSLFGENCHGQNKVQRRVVLVGPQFHIWHPVTCPAFEFRQCSRATIPSHTFVLYRFNLTMKVLHAGTEYALQIFRLTAGVGVRLLWSFQRIWGFHPTPRERRSHDRRWVGIW